MAEYGRIWGPLKIIGSLFGLFGASLLLPCVGPGIEYRFITLDHKQYYNFICHSCLSDLTFIVSRESYDFARGLHPSEGSIYI